MTPFSDDPTGWTGPPEGGAPIPEPPLTFVERHRIPVVLFVVLTLLVIGIAYQGIGTLVTELLVGTVPTAATINVFRLINGAGELTLLLVPTILATLLMTRRPAEFLRLRGADGRAVLLSLAAMFSLEQVLQVYSVLQDRLEQLLPEPVRSTVFDLQKMVDDLTRMFVTAHSGGELVWVVVVVALVPAVAEELLFRGFMQRSLETVVTPVKSAVVTGIVFAAFHLNPFSFVPLAVLGIFLGFIALRSGSILTAMAAHFFNNFAACMSVYLNMKDDFVMTGNAEEMSAAALLVTVLLFGALFALSLYFFIRVTRQPDSPTVPAS